MLKKSKNWRKKGINHEAFIFADFFVQSAHLFLDNQSHNRQQEKRNEYQSLVINDGPFGNALAVSFFGIARACARASTIFTAVSKRDGVN